MSIPRRLSRFSNREVAALFGSATRIQKTNYWDVLIAPRAYTDGRLLVATPRVLGTAPERNKIRRQVRTLYRQLHGFKTIYDLIILIKKPALSYSFQELKEHLTNLIDLLAAHEKISV